MRTFQLLADTRTVTAAKKPSGFGLRVVSVTVIRGGSGRSGGYSSSSSSSRRRRRKYVVCSS